jgi:hypothetical protein
MYPNALSIHHIIRHFDVDLTLSSHTTRAGGADRDGHPGEEEVRGGDERAKEGMRPDDMR